MSETPTTAPATENLPQAVTSLLPVIKNLVSVANGIALKVKGATQGEEAKVDAILATSDDEKIAAWRAQDAHVREQIKAAQAKLDENRASMIAHAKTLVSSDDTIDVAKATEEFLSARSEITTMTKVITMILGGDKDRTTAVLNAHGIEQIVNLRKGTAGATTGKPKPRLSAASVDGTDIPKPTFTTVAKFLGVDIDVLKEQAYAAAKKVGGTDEAPMPAGVEVTFQSVNGKKETVTVSLTGRSDKKVATEENAENVSTETENVEDVETENED